MLRGCGDVCPAHPPCLRPALGALWTWLSVNLPMAAVASYALCFMFTVCTQLSQWNLVEMPCHSHASQPAPSALHMLWVDLSKCFMTFSRAVGQLLQARRGVPAQVRKAVWNLYSRPHGSFDSAAGMTLRAYSVAASLLPTSSAPMCGGTVGRRGSAVKCILHSCKDTQRSPRTCNYLRSLHVAQSQQVALRNRDLPRCAAMLHTALASIVPRGPP